MARIDPSNPTPIFLQIAELLRSRIGAGVFIAGELIPSVRATAEEFLVNPNTVQRAYEQLERDGLIKAQKGLGMVVQEGAKSLAMNGTGEQLHDLLAKIVAAAIATGIPRSVVDRAYRKAWQDGEQNRRAT